MGLGLNFGQQIDIYACHAGPPPQVCISATPGLGPGKEIGFIMDVTSSYLSQSIKQEAGSDGMSPLAGKVRHTAQGLQLRYLPGMAQSL